MIKFFRKIRQKLLSENKFNKYIVYAIGEIILVVIGILIALQINNNNEATKNKEKKKIILKEILTSLNNDFKGFDNFWDSRLERRKEGLDSLQNYIFENKKVSDEKIQDAYFKSKQGILFRFDNGSFEALKSLGLDIITNDSLRSRINAVYTVSLPIYINLSKDITKEFESRIQQKEDDFLMPTKVVHENDDKHIHYRFKVPNILENKSFLEIYSIENRKYQVYKNNTENMRTSMTKLKVLIEEELKKMPTENH